MSYNRLNDSGNRAEILVVGLGISGRAAARYLRKQGFKVAVSDLRPAAELGKILPELKRYGIGEIESGGHTPEFFVNRRLIVVSPGVPLESAPLAAARKAGVEIIGEVELAGRENRIPLIGLTGTNGKTTTVTLLGEILAAAGLRPFVGGNLGRPAIEMGEGDYDLAILELSSFQLESISHLHPRIAVILNLTPDHQDRYRDTAAYLAAKAAISRNQQANDFLLLNLDDPHLAAHGRALDARRAAGDLLPRVIWFSLKRECDCGASWCGRRITVRLPDIEGQGWEELEICAPDLKLPGEHNRGNALAALLAARLYGVEMDTILEVLGRFAGVEHRLEYLGEVDAIACYNDSKATNLDAVAKAVESFDRPLVLLLGGYDKGADFTSLVPLLERRRVRVVAFGAAGEKLVGQLGQLVAAGPETGLKAAWNRARELARPGEIILLAPGCASFDEFTDYRERGAAFRNLVERAQRS